MKEWNKRKDIGKEKIRVVEKVERKNFLLKEKRENKERRKMKE